MTTLEIANNPHNHTAMSFLDTIIGWVSPSWALQREISRQTLHSIQSRAYEAAAYGRRTKNWRATSTSPTTEAGIAVNVLRNRSREMVRNNGWARKAIGVIANNTIGTGIRPAFSHKNKKTADTVKQAWNFWANSIKCDFDKRLNLYGLQNLIMRAVAEGGECLIIKKIDPKTQQLRLQVLEGDYIDHLKHTAGIIAKDVNGEFDFYGVRFNAKGERIGIWLYDNHPTDFGNMTSKLYTDADVIHVFEVLRAGQARGVPMGAPCFIRLRDMSDYEDAQLMRQKVAACFSVFVQQNATALPSQTAQDDRLERVEPAMIQYLSPGETVSFGNPPPAEGYEPYMRTVARGIAAGYEITYEALTGDYSNVNFSSGRMGWLEFARTVERWQRDIMMPALERVAEWFLDVLVMKTAKAADVLVEWTAPRRQMIDPAKETASIISQVQAGLMSYQEALRQLGYDPDDTLQELQGFYTLIDALGLKLATDFRNNIKPANTAETPPNENN